MRDAKLDAPPNPSARGGGLDVRGAALDVPPPPAAPQHRRGALDVRGMELDAPPQGGEGELGAREERGLTAGWRHGKP